MKPRIKRQSQQVKETRLIYTWVFHLDPSARTLRSWSSKHGRKDRMMMKKQEASSYRTSSQKLRPPGVSSTDTLHKQLRITDFVPSILRDSISETATADVVKTAKTEYITSSSGAL
ncbi:hypothetical protein AVEN_34887-1 [Araneus ventricosus]|uniref:Uncharacterized protein n=1 Tax=Araneus ventricosus TaxID=182803 RepID=A0A4Y2UM89_ARAVE|nr:hypothetical protein AVEN_34887-1 [Araneus ventricosus]